MAELPYHALAIKSDTHVKFFISHFSIPLNRTFEAYATANIEKIRHIHPAATGDTDTVLSFRLFLSVPLKCYDLDFGRFFHEDTKRKDGSLVKLLK